MNSCIDIAPEAATEVSVLIVEDERIIARGVEKRLKSMGYRVAASAASGEEALRLALETRPDLVLMDISLGAGIDGIEAAERIRREMDLPVVYLTAYSDEVTLSRAKLSDPFGYVLKPYGDRELQTAIEIGLYRHRMERRLRESEQWLAAMLGSIGDGVIATTESGSVRFMNPLAEQLTGWPQQEARGRDIREIFQILEESTREPLANPLLRALDTGEVVTLPPDSVLLEKNGQLRPIEDCAAPIRNQARNVMGAVLVFRDVTERRRMEECMRQSLKMEAIGNLAGGIAHDFNNILTVINGYSELLLAETGLSEDQRDAIRSMREAGQRAASLTGQILAFSRKQLLAPRVLNLNSVIDEYGLMIRRLIGSDIDFVTHLDPGAGHVLADAAQLGQVLLNLAVNARDAMPNGGRLTVVTRQTHLDEEYAHHHPDVAPGDYATFEVTDTGRGMEKDVLDRIFEPYFTTKEMGQGTGLGLATVYGIIKQSGGHIEVESTPGIGSAFRVHLPRVGILPAPDAGERPDPPRGWETILVVEDDPAVRMMTKALLKERGYHVLEAENGKDALQLLSAPFAPEVHLLITDLVMPHVSGGELARRLRESHPDIAVLYTSGYTEDRIVRQGVASGSEAFLQKPYSFAELAHRVREILDRKTVNGPYSDP